jgi:threonylcarbamoyladenosine tRNA methylthiotransferase MtaB
MSTSYVVKTLGCKANLYDSQQIEAELQKRGWHSHSAGSGGVPTLCIVNSCTVTDEADRQSRKMASRLSRENPNARVVMTGCAAEVDPERMARSKGIHYVIGNRSKPELVDMILRKLATEPVPSVPGAVAEILGGASGYSEMISRHPMDREWFLDEGFSTPVVGLAGQSAKTRSFLKIQEGCNAFCTYCIIPYGRGPSRSIKPEEVIRQIRELVSQGIQEVVITGTNIGDYGTDWGAETAAMSENLVALFKMIFTDTELKRLRVSSLDPSEITSDLLNLMRTESRFCPHFHVSLQSPHSRILKLMKRKYSTPEVKGCLEQIATIRTPTGSAFVGMDVITGFPGETDAEFEESYELLEKLPWTRLHVFPYSEREGTPATRLPGSVPVETRVKRARKLQALSLKRMTEAYERVLAESASTKILKSVLLENAKADSIGGYSPGYFRVLLPSGEARALRNSLVDVTLSGVLVDEAAGEVAFSGTIGK